MKLPNPYVGTTPPSGIRVPDPDELIHNICSEWSPRANFAYPPDAPTFWIKYGFAVGWNEVCAQVMAYEGLQQLESEVRAPAVFYAETIRTNPPATYIVMEYIPGKTAGQCLAEAQDDQAEELLARSVSLAISELYRIPVDPGTRPAAISGDKIKYDPVWEFGAPLHYENVQQMEDHFNEVCFVCVDPFLETCAACFLIQRRHK